MASPVGEEAAVRPFRIDVPEEDLVELLTRMGYPPQDTVKLVVQPLTSSTTQVFEEIPMTGANRQAIYRAARARESDAQQPATRPAD